jgi:hypothetical protein
MRTKFAYIMYKFQSYTYTHITFSAMHFKKRRRPKKKANLSSDILALHIGTNSEVERRPAHLEPQAINKL